MGGAEAEGFGVGGGHVEPTPALRATPPEGIHQWPSKLICKIRVLPLNIVLVVVLDTKPEDDDEDEKLFSSLCAPRRG